MAWESTHLKDVDRTSESEQKNSFRTFPDGSLRGDVTWDMGPFLKQSCKSRQSPATEELLCPNQGRKPKLADPTNSILGEKLKH